MKKRTSSAVTEICVERYQTLRPLIDGLYADIRNLASRKQDGALAKQRIGMINRLLQDAKNLLENESTVAYLELLDEDQIPKNSDAVIILGQYRSALDHYFRKHTIVDFGTRKWLTPGVKIEVEES